MATGQGGVQFEHSGWQRDRQAGAVSTDQDSTPRTTVARLWNPQAPVASPVAPRSDFQASLIAQAAASALGQRAPPLQG